MKQHYIFTLLTCLCVLSSAHADSLLSDLVAPAYTGPTVEDQIALMDKDHNGFADVYEVRAYLELMHGKGYQKELLDKWELSAKGKSCTTPFAKELYTDRDYQNKTN